ncbi:MAG: hypothetical protein EXS00_08485 [Phycisphaerales bacterium]|nr:hypothetical protein [Phycisphaerales bacterium]
MTHKSQEQSRVDAAFLHCRELTKRSARNFYYGLQLTPEPRRSAMFAIYAWMRRVDDLCDDADADDALSVGRLEKLRERTLVALSGVDPSLPACAVSASAPMPPDEAAMWTAFTATAERHRLWSSDFCEMVDEQILDLKPRHLESWEDTMRFCWGMASTVGRICISVWGYSGVTAPALAAERGYAFQLTNVLRDFAEDFDRGRVYLPAADFRSAGLTPSELRTWARPAECAGFIRQQVGRVRGFYADSSRLEAEIAGDCRATLWAMTEIYRGILERIASDPRAAMRTRVRLPIHNKSMIVWRARSLSRAAST